MTVLVQAPATRLRQAIDIRDPEMLGRAWLRPDRKEWLLDQPEVAAAMMSGSGSTMMAFLKEDDGGDALLDRARSNLDPTLWGCKVEVQ